MGTEESVAEDFRPEAATPSPPERSRSIDRDRLVRAAVSFSAAMLISFGAGVPLLRAMKAPAFALVIALAAALASRRAVDAAIVAPLGLLAGAFAGSLALPLAQSGILPTVALATLLCAPLAAGLVLVVEKAPRTAPMLTVLALALVIALGWLDALSTASVPLSSESWATGYPTGPPVTFAQALATEPRLTPETASDAGVFLSAVYRLRAGQDYYTASIETLSTYNRMRPPGNPVDSPLAHRLPTLYLLLSRLPDNPLSPILAALALQAAAAICAFALARRYVAASLALAGAALVSAQLSFIARTPMLLYTEPWAGAFGLVAATLLVRAYARERPRPWLLASAALAALAAALMREFGAAFLVLGLAAVLAAPETRRPRYWAPWAGCLALAGVAYAAHARALVAAAAAVHVPASGDGAARFFHPDGLGLVGAAGEVGKMLSLHSAGTWILLAAAMAGSLLLFRTCRAERMMLAGIVTAGSLVMLVVRTPGFYFDGTPVGYWYEVIAPTMLACVPLAMRLVPGLRADDETAATAPPASTV